MKILIAVSNLYSGGAERVAALWGIGFEKEGYDVAYVLHKEEESIVYEIPKDSKLFFLNQKGSKGKHVLSFFAIFKMRKVIKEYNPDVIISVLHPWGLLAWIASKGIGVPVINTEHNTFKNPDYKPMSIKRRIHKFVFNKLMDYVTVITQYDKDYVKGKLKKVEYLPNPLAFTPVNEIPQKKKNVLAVGRLDSWEYKGFDLLIKAWGEVASKHPQWTLFIVGSGSDKSRIFLSNIAKEHGVSDRIVFKDYTKDILNYYKETSVFVLSSRYEGFGMVLIEAMSQGCACIACNYQGRQAEIITSSKEGILIEPNNSDLLAQSIDKLISNPSLIKYLQENAVKRSKSYDLMSIINMWKVLFGKMGLINQQD